MSDEKLTDEERAVLLGERAREGKILESLVAIDERRKSLRITDALTARVADLERDVRVALGQLEAERASAEAAELDAKENAQGWSSQQRRADRADQAAALRAERDAATGNETVSCGDGITIRAVSVSPECRDGLNVGGARLPARKDVDHDRAVLREMSEARIHESYAGGPKFLARPSEQRLIAAELARRAVKP